MLENYEKWVKSFMDSWQRLDGIKTTEYMSKDATYYENPIDKPCESFEEIQNLWKDVSNNQKDISYTFDIVSFNDEFAFVNFKMERFFIPTNENQLIDGIFQISLDNNNLCTYFKQWRFTKSTKMEVIK